MRELWRCTASFARSEVSAALGVVARAVAQRVLSGFERLGGVERCVLRRSRYRAGQAASTGVR
ncbi:hypothetical protein KJY78_04920 [Canibacter sp. lx-45]|uniref:hypothetical protein n=1 Tax=Canibacter zhuwentaonis TaxID=2837491 RepID=UPI001BDD2856|nr:hypothetical protein [Canibacter zhuwentaonis]MBT1035688.1 hypothetical protein [Canibacter zhuwentaonis]